MGGRGEARERRGEREGEWEGYRERGDRGRDRERRGRERCLVKARERVPLCFLPTSGNLPVSLSIVTRYMLVPIGLELRNHLLIWA